MLGDAEVATIEEALLRLGYSQENKLSGLVNVFQKPELDFANNRVGDNDILGDAHELLMRKFAQDSGKAQGNSILREKFHELWQKLLILAVPLIQA